MSQNDAFICWSEPLDGCVGDSVPSRLKLKVKTPLDPENLIDDIFKNVVHLVEETLESNCGSYRSGRVSKSDQEEPKSNRRSYVKKNVRKQKEAQKVVNPRSNNVKQHPKTLKMSSRISTDEFNRTVQRHLANSVKAFGTIHSPEKILNTVTQTLKKVNQFLQGVESFMRKMNLTVYRKLRHSFTHKKFETSLSRLERRVKRVKRNTVKMNREADRSDISVTESISESCVQLRSTTQITQIKFELEEQPKSLHSGQSDSFKENNDQLDSSNDSSATSVIHKDVYFSHQKVKSVLESGEIVPLPNKSKSSPTRPSVKISPLPDSCREKKKNEKCVVQ